MTDNHVSLGLGAAWGFSGADLTSPANAAAAGAMPDALSGMPVVDGVSDSQWNVTELRVHGVSGSDGPTMLEHPHAVQVAGDSVTMFLRRWTPAGRGGNSVPWKLEAYSWGGLTEAPLAAAAWILLAPFMLFNLGHFMLPRTKGRRALPDEEHVPPRLSRDGWHVVAAALLRLLAVTATIQFTLTVVASLMNGLAYQAPQVHGPAWLGTLTQRSPNIRIALATIAVTGVIAALWWVSVATAHRYEARVSKANPMLNASCPLTQPTFWCGHELVRRQRSLHTAAALAVIALVAARPSVHVGGFRLLLEVGAAVLMGAVLVTLCLPLADRHSIVLSRWPIPVAGERRSWVGRGVGRPGARKSTRGTHWCQALLWLGVVAVGASLFAGGWHDPVDAGPRTIDGFAGIWAGLLLAQLSLLLLLWAVVATCARRARAESAGLGRDCSDQPRFSPADGRVDPFLRGHLTTVIALLGVCGGGALSSLLVLFVTRLLGTPLPSGLRMKVLPAHALEVPWPLYAFAAAPFGAVAALLPAAIWLWGRWRQDVNQFATKSPRSSLSPIRVFYGNTYGDPDGREFDDARLRVARAWATARLTDRGAIVALALTLGASAAIVTGEVLGWRFKDTVSHPFVHGLASAESWVGLLLAGVLVSLLRSAYRDPSKRKTIGALWDVGTFWPRAAHPFAPPCYGERAIPELVDRIRVLTGQVPPNAGDPAWLSIKAHQRNSDESPHLAVEPGPLLLTGYSQGAAIAPAVIAQLPTETVGNVAMLTLASPARRLYGRAFPAYFGPCELASLADRLMSPNELAAPGEPERQAPWPSSWVKVRWRNLVRETDYIGSWVQAPTRNSPAAHPLTSGLDQPCWDPPAMTPNTFPTPPPIHRHLDFWQDPRTAQLGRELVLMLGDSTGPSMAGATSKAP